MPFSTEQRIRRIVRLRITPLPDGPDDNWLAFWLDNPSRFRHLERRVLTLIRVPQFQCRLRKCCRSGICHGSGPDQPPCLTNLDENAEAVFYQLLRIGMYYDVLIGDDPFKNVTAAAEAEADGGRSEVAR